VADARSTARIYVLAGPNGAGKSSIGGAMFRSEGAEYFNPDEVAAKILSANQELSQEQANSEAWQQGKRLLERAIGERLDFAFETTLGGNTIPNLLQRAIAAGIEVRVWYVGLEGPELHIARVRARVARGGHAISESKIRERYDRSRLNLIRLIPGLAELLLYDNSAEADPQRGEVPEPRVILHMVRGQVVATCDLPTAPEWTKPILAAAITASGRDRP
jgi:predicted ABC-type ATPase